MQEKKKHTTYWGTIKRLYQERKLATASALVSKNIVKYGYPLQSDLLYLAARIYRQTGEWESALQCWEQFFSVDPENYSKLDALNEMALCFSKSHQYEAAERIFDQLLLASPRDKLALFGKSQVQVTLLE